MLSAMHDFAVHGYEGARVDRIAEGASINKAMIYYHFRSKEELYRETIGEVYREATDKLSSLFTGEETLEEILHAVAAYHHDLMRKYPEFRSVLMRELAHPRREILSYIFGIFEASGLPSRLLARFGEEIKAGRVRKSDPRQLMISFLTLNLGYVMLAPLFDLIMGISDRELFVEDRKKEVVKLFLNGIRSGRS
ncbi:MAG: TetR/AcrR family transcriptional regulator [Candidatus Krumholzibacteria bacterium]|nr:TetR/AcrR family transcriptional regulator [Candidatus Krumholzibacteria bacterium]